MFGKFLVGALCMLSSFISIHAQVTPDLYRSADRKAMKHWVDSVFDSLSPDERIGQLFMVVADPGASYHERITGYINDLKIGGVLFSGGKLLDQAESINLYQQTSRVPLFISFDGEWGLAMRLKEDTPVFPHNMMLGAVQDPTLIREYGKEVGRECNELGVHINFAPVLDVNVNPANPVIGDRSFGENPYLVAEKGIAYAKGLESRKVVAVGKHFPGHGDTDTDSHHALPRIPHKRPRLDSIELYPFTQFINSGFAGIMTGHLSVPALDASTGLPSSLSPKIVRDLLMNELAFTGLTFTDALVMAGAAGGKYSTCVQALLAGNDILLSPAKPASEFAAVKKAVAEGILSREAMEARCRKILEYKYIAGLHNYTPIRLNGLAQRINTPRAAALIKQLNNAAITLLKNEGKTIPLGHLDEKTTAVVLWGADKTAPFHETMALYGKADFYPLSESSDFNLAAKLKPYDRVIIAVHSSKVNDSAALQSFCKQKETHLCFFISAYRLARFKTSIGSAASVTLAYENNAPAQQAAAEVLMGGIAAQGKLPVGIQGLFEYGTGIATEKVRLSYGTPEEVGMSGPVLDEIEKIVAEGIREKAFPGCQVLVAKDGVVVYNKSFGYFDYTNRRAVKNTDLYDLASLTKALATVPAVMKLYDSKQIGLQDALSSYIPELKGTDKAHITVKNALLHETGLASFLPFYTALIDKDSYTGPLYSGKRNPTYSIEYDRNVFMRKDYSFLSEMISPTAKKGFGRQVADGIYVTDGIEDVLLRLIIESPLRKNRNYLYSDLNFMLLKIMVENIVQHDFDLFLEEKLYAPLGADFTAFRPLNGFDRRNIAPTEKDDFLRGQLLTGFVHDEAAAVLGGVSGNAGLFSNANDVAKIVQLFLNGGSYGGEKYFSRSATDTFTQTKSASSRRGLGFDKPDMKNTASSPTGLLAPASTFGHTGYTGTCFWADPDNNLIYVFLSNRVHPSRLHTNLMKLNIRPRIHDVIYRSLT